MQLTYNRIKVLIIDDDLWMQKVLSKTLQKLGVEQIITASNGFDGINYAIDSSPDIIFLDLIMPELNGLLTLKILKNINKTKLTPIIIVTANSDYDNLGAVLKLAASDFVVKPFTSRTINSKLIKTLNIAQDNFVEADEPSPFDSLDLENDQAQFFNTFVLDFDEKNILPYTTNKDTNTTPGSPPNKKDISSTYFSDSTTEIDRLLK